MTPVLTTPDRKPRVRRTIGFLAIAGGLATAVALPALAQGDRPGEAAGTAAATSTTTTVAPAADPFAEWFAALGPDDQAAFGAFAEASQRQAAFQAWYDTLSPADQATFSVYSMTPEQQAAFVAMVSPPPPPPAPKPEPKPEPKPKATPTTGTGTPPNSFLACVRHRESRGNYGVVNRSSGAGGAYQFLQGTWNNTARHAGRGDLVGIHPSTASAADQDAMAATLYAWQGRAPWAGNGC
jgi:hypothetical protein